MDGVLGAYVSQQGHQIPHYVPVLGGEPSRLPDSHREPASLDLVDPGLEHEKVHRTEPSQNRIGPGPDLPLPLQEKVHQPHAQIPEHDYLGDLLGCLIPALVVVHEGFQYHIGGIRGVNPPHCLGKTPSQGAGMIGAANLKQSAVRNDGHQLGGGGEPSGGDQSFADRSHKDQRSENGVRRGLSGEQQPVDVVHNVHHGVGLSPLGSHAGKLTQLVYGIQNPVLITAVKILQVLVDDLPEGAPGQGFLELPAHQHPLLEDRRVQCRNEVREHRPVFPGTGGGFLQYPAEGLPKLLGGDVPYGVALLEPVDKLLEDDVLQSAVQRSGDRLGNKLAVPGNEGVPELVNGCVLDTPCLAHLRKTTAISDLGGFPVHQVDEVEEFLFIDAGLEGYAVDPSFHQVGEEILNGFGLGFHLHVVHHQLAAEDGDCDHSSLAVREGAQEVDETLKGRSDGRMVRGIHADGPLKEAEPGNQVLGEPGQSQGREGICTCFYIGLYVRPGDQPLPAVHVDGVNPGPVLLPGEIEFFKDLFDLPPHPTRPGALLRSKHPGIRIILTAERCQDRRTGQCGLR